jgi:hypothetical protein
MRFLRILLAKTLAIFRRRRFEQELEKEINEHLVCLENRFMEQGMTFEEARCAARSAFGGIDRLKEANRVSNITRCLNRTMSTCPRRHVHFALRTHLSTNRNSRMLGVVGRLKPAASIENAQADLNVIANRLQEEYPEAYSKAGGCRPRRHDAGDHN